MNLVKTISTELDILARRLVKVLRYGRSDVQTPVQAGPYGTDSNPIEGMVAVYAETREKGKNVIVGYLNRNQAAAPGEYRVFSTDENGAVKTFIWLKADGIMQLAGNADNAVRFAPMNTGLQNFKDAIQAELTKIATGISGAGGSYTPGTLDVDVSGAKIDKIKTP